MSLYDKIRSVEFPSLLKQLKDGFPTRVEVDRAVLRVLGVGDAEVDQILDCLYPALANEIEQLKKLMQG